MLILWLESVDEVALPPFGSNAHVLIHERRETQGVLTFCVQMEHSSAMHLFKELNEPHSSKTAKEEQMPASYTVAE